MKTQLEDESLKQAYFLENLVIKNKCRKPNKIVDV